MSIPELIVNNILPTLGGGGLLIIGLSTFLGRVWSKRIIMKEKASIENDINELRAHHDKELKLLEANIQSELLRKDQFHQISKSTFESIFDKRIDLYSELLKTSLEFRRFAREGVYLEIDDPTETLWEYHSIIRDLIENNRLYVTKALFEKYSAWYEKAVPYLKEADVNGYQAHIRADTDQERELSILIAQLPIFGELISETKAEFASILEQVDRDIDELRRNIEVPLTK